MKRTAFILAICILTTLVFSSCNDSVKAFAYKSSDSKEEAVAALGIDLLRQSSNNKKGENSMVSPLSISVALSMAANAAEGKTLEQMKNIITGGASIDELNIFYKELITRYEEKSSSNVIISDSIWYRNNLNVQREYLDIINDCYKSELKAIDFKDPKTVDVINDWVKNKTKGKIDKIIEKTTQDTAAVLINTIYFNNEWIDKFSSSKPGKFYSNDKEYDANYMFSNVNSYIKGKEVEGFIKPFKDGDFSFIALLPDKGTSPEEYLSGLTGEKLFELIKNAKSESGTVKIPKFKAEYATELNDNLKQLGMTDAFDANSAQFPKIGDVYINKVMHKTYIDFNETGVTAAGATSIEMNFTGFPNYKYELEFNRPFIYMIIDNQNNIPLFIGIMNNPK